MLARAQQAAPPLIQGESSGVISKEGKKKPKCVAYFAWNMVDKELIEPSWRKE